MGIIGSLPGKTPEATMASALYTDIKKWKDGKAGSVFCRWVPSPAIPPRTCDKVGPGPKITKLTLYHVFFTPVIGSDNGGFTRQAAQSRKNVDGYFRRFGHPTECHDATRFSVLVDRFNSSAS